MLGVSINGTTPGDGITAGTYSQLVVTGSINLNNAHASGRSEHGDRRGHHLHDRAKRQRGHRRFQRLAPEGSVVTAADGSEFSISYQADGGDAVVLTALLPVVTRVSLSTDSPRAVQR